MRTWQPNIIKQWREENLSPIIFYLLVFGIIFYININITKLNEFFNTVFDKYLKNQNILMPKIFRILKLL